MPEAFFTLGNEFAIGNKPFTVGNQNGSLTNEYEPASIYLYLSHDFDRCDKYSLL